MSRENNKKNDEYLILERRKRVSELYLQGLVQWQIAQVLNTSQPTICGDLKAIRDGWIASAILNWDELKAKELAALDYQEEELWKAWFRSCGVEEVKTRNVERELRSVDGEPEVEVTKKKSKKLTSKLVPVKKSNKTVTKQLIGDPRWMAEIWKVRELRCRILGFLKHEEEKPNQQQVNIAIDWDALAKPRLDPIEEELKQLENMVKVQPLEGTNGKAGPTDGG